MEIGRIQSNINRDAVSKKPVAFKGAKEVAASTIEDCMYDVVGQRYKSVKFIKKLTPLQGELGGVIITAIGTGAVAPIFIAFNPFAKTDSDTKKYTAMRQPVSAVLSMAFQAALYKPISGFIERLANEGLLGNYPLFNRKEMNTEGYVKAKFKKQGYKEGKELTEKVEAYQKAQLAKIQAELSKNGTITIAGTAVENDKMMSLINNTIKSYTKDFEKAKSDIEAKNRPFKIERAQTLYKEREQLRAIMLDIADKNKNGDDILNAISTHKVAHSDNKKIVQLLEEIKNIKDPTEMRGRAENTLKRITDVKLGVKNAEEMIANASKFETVFSKIALSDPEKLEALSMKQIDNIVNAELGKTAKDKTKNKLLREKLNKLSQYKTKEGKIAYAQHVLNKLEGLKQADGNVDKIITVLKNTYYDKEIKELQIKLDIFKKLLITNEDKANIKDKLKNIEQEIKKLTQGTGDLFGDMAKNYQKHLDGAFKGFKQISSALVLTLVMLPITCTALNWVYPRFMRMFFPSLSKDSPSGPPPQSDDKNAKGVK